MPSITEYKCNKCGFELKPGWGGYAYILDHGCKRVADPHLIIFGKIVSGPILQRALEPFREFLRRIWKPYYQRFIQMMGEVRGFNYYCLCLDCLTELELDVEKEERKCRKCGSKNVRIERELVGLPCPKCKEGTIEEIMTGKIA